MQHSWHERVGSNTRLSGPGGHRKGYGQLHADSEQGEGEQSVRGVDRGRGRPVRQDAIRYGLHGPQAGVEGPTAVPYDLGQGGGREKLAAGRHRRREWRHASVRYTVCGMGHEGCDGQGNCRRGLCLQDRGQLVMGEHSAVDRKDPCGRRQGNLPGHSQLLSRGCGQAGDDVNLGRLGNL